MWETILISLITSIVVSIPTFIFGLKSGKNQADRVKLQLLYKSLYTNLRDIKEGLQRSNPKHINDLDYKLSEYSVKKSSYYVPTAENMELIGDSIYLEQDLFNKAKDIESKALQYSDDIDDELYEIMKIIENDPELMSMGLNIDEDVINGVHKIRSGNPDNCHDNYEINLALLFDPASWESTISKLDDEKDEIELYLIGKQGPFTVTGITLYRNGLNVKYSEFAAKMIQEISNKVTNYTALCNKRIEYIKILDECEKKLEKRAQEPISFWETVGGAISDVFH